MKYLITGAAGFIGFHLAKELLKNKKNKVYGLDNLDNYYSVKLKKKRLSILKKNKNFTFIKIDLSNESKMKKLKIYHSDIIFHLAAQAGVRYTIKNPNKYVSTNTFGFMNFLKYIEKNKAKIVFYASSSSVYGDNKSFPVGENFLLKPKNIYAFTKLTNEINAKLFSHLFCKKFIGLRFFTVYGEWGRPDMLIYKYLLSAIKKETFYINNFGKDYRDFTYIKDVIKLLLILIKNKNKLKQNDIFNICSNNPLQTKKIIENLRLHYPTKLKYVSANKVEILKTHGDNKKIKKVTSIKKFSNFDDNINNCILWFKKNYKLLI
jgi:UDP-glucuronate 4-epimerase